MRRIADTNILIRYLVCDNEELAEKAREIISKGVEILPEEISEALYVLTSKTLYNVPRKKASEILIDLLDEVIVEKENDVREALKIYGETKLDYVDCLLIAVTLSENADVISFDKKLNNELIRRKKQLCKEF